MFYVVIIKDMINRCFLLALNRVVYIMMIDTLQPSGRTPYVKLNLHKYAAYKNAPRHMLMWSEVFDVIKLLTL